MHRMKCLIPLVALGAFTLPSPGWSEVRALLIGVGDYQYLDVDLRGPVNDVGLMARALMARGADRVTVLADPGARLPDGAMPAGVATRAAVLEGLSALADGVGPGDTVIFYFSGHGSQAPDMNGDKAVGYDEILLPADARGWSGAIGAVENAIVDDELQPFFQTILDTGAKLVAILDACCAATGFRAVTGGGGVERFVPPSVLGLPEEQPQGSEEATGHIAPPLTGDFAFLYSSQPDERSFEYPLGDKSNPANWFGHFTRSLSNVLTEVPELTWAQALAGAMDGMQAGNPIAVQTPDGEGTALESPVFGTGRAGARRALTEGLALQAGLLSGFADGAVFDVFADAMMPDPVAQAVLRAPGADSGKLDLLSGDMPSKGYARQVQPGLPSPFRLSSPVVRDGADYAPILGELAALAAAGLPEGVVWNAAEPDAVIVLSDGKLALTGPDGVLDPLGSGSSPRMDKEPAAFFDRATRAHRLRRALVLAETGGPVGFTLPGSGLSQIIERQQGAPTDGKCDEPSAGVEAFSPVQPVTDCDRLWLSLTNDSKTAQDVTVLYIDRDFHISVLWPDPGLSNRIGFGETREIGMVIRAADRLPGQEEIIVLAVPARPGSPSTVLSALADPSATRAGPGAPALQIYLEAAADPAATYRNLGFTGAPAPLKVTRTRLNLMSAPR